MRWRVARSRQDPGAGRKVTLVPQPGRGVVRVRSAGGGGQPNPIGLILPGWIEPGLGRAGQKTAVRDGSDFATAWG